MSVGGYWHRSSNAVTLGDGRLDGRDVGKGLDGSEPGLWRSSWELVFNWDSCQAEMLVGENAPPSHRVSLVKLPFLLYQLLQLHLSIVLIDICECLLA